MNNERKLQLQKLKPLADHRLDHPDKIKVGSYIINSFKVNGTLPDSPDPKNLFITILAKSYMDQDTLVGSYDQLMSTNYKVNDWDINKIIKKYLSPETVPEQASERIPKRIPEQVPKPITDGEMSPDMTTILQHEGEKYIRVATDYYRLSHMLNARKQSVPVQQLWRKGAIAGDFGKEIFRYIKKYVAFVNIPDNSETYLKEHLNNGDAYFNLYEQIKFVPAPGDLTITLKFISRIFQDKLEIILDYLKILYENPTQNLPVICLVSKIQETGKSTYMMWLCSIFGRNAIILGNEEFSTNFNSLYASKLIICIDESFIDKTIIKEKIKRLTTTDTINMEAKCRDSIRMDFFGKLILLSNTEDNFIKMDEDDNRFFVVKVPQLTPLDFIPDLMTHLEDEIPAFLHMLRTRNMVYPKKSRLWFDPKVYETEALSKIRINTRSIVQKEMIRWCEDIFAFDEAGDQIHVIPKKLAEELEKSLRQVSGLATQITHILKEEWKLSQATNGKFKFPSVIDDYDATEQMRVSKISFTRNTGKYFTITREFIDSKS